MSDTPEQRMITYLRNLGYDVSTGDSVDARSRMGKLENQINELESRSGLMSKSWFTRVYTA